MVASLLVSGCVFQESPEIEAPQGSTNNSVIDPNNLLNNATNNSPNNSTNNSTNNLLNPLVQKCAEFCDTVLGRCVLDNCELTNPVESIRAAEYEKCLGTGPESCIKKYKSDFAFRDIVEAFPAGECFDTKVETTRCVTFGFQACDCPLPDLTSGCPAQEDCDSGYLASFCQVENAGGVPSGGQCIFLGCFIERPALNFSKSDRTGCGTENLCIRADDQTFCVQGCSATQRCNPGFECRLELDDGASGYCDFVCNSDMECQSQDRAVCSTTPADASGFCVPKCDSNADCGLGTCTANAEGSTYCVD